MICRINISLRSDTLERLDQLAFEEHKSRSQAITDLVWKAKVKNNQLPGQMNMADMGNIPSSNRKRR